MSQKKHRKYSIDPTVLASTDSTFVDRGSFWEGKCIHCKTKLRIRNDGKLLDKTSIEHIVPRNKGGSNELTNLAFACKSCNGMKGRDVDILSENNPKYQKVVGFLVERRKERWVDPGI